MVNLSVYPASGISGDITVPGDKSISHRAIILSSISQRVVTISNLCLGEDVLSTVNAMRSLGVRINLDDASCKVFGVGLYGLKPAKNPINCGNAGTTMRLLSGLLAAQKFNSVLVGDDSLTKRPMLRVAQPLRLMGAKIKLSDSNTAPIEITASGAASLNAIHYNLPVPSAQVKSAIMLAGLYAEGETTVYENIKTRDHTERMIQFLLSSSTSELVVPGDISSAAFFIVLAAITPGSNLIIRQVGVNPLRTGVIDILKLMGAKISLLNETCFGLEPVADIHIQYALLRGVEIPRDLIAKAIDEFPAIFIAAVTAVGKTILRGASELRVKESDRISTMVNGLRAVGVSVQEYEDGLGIEGAQIFKGGQVDACGDHRIAMAFAIAGNISKNPIVIGDCQNVATSFPGFVKLAVSLGMKING